jgi:threonine/homoserine/homoserine lactone efflux protein
MPFEMLAALAGFAFVAAMTPGPNNIMLTASGVNFGFSRTVPHMLGVCAGFAVLDLGVGLGVGALFMALPQLRTALKLIGAVYMLWLAWKVATAARHGESPEPRSAQPLTFWQAAVFQWVNPKGWVMTLGAMALYVRPETFLADVLIVTLVFGLMTIPAVLTWSGFGHALRRALRDPVRVRMFNTLMALLLVASIVPIVWLE